MKTVSAIMELENTLISSRETFHPFSESPTNQPPYDDFSSTPTSPTYEEFPPTPTSIAYDAFPDQPITPEIKRIDSKSVIDSRRDSSFSIQSDDTSSTHIKCFRTPSVVVSDHSEDTGSIVFDEIRRIHGVLHRRSRRSRRHSDVLQDVTHHGRLFSDNENYTDSSTNSDATEYYKGSNNASPVPRRKHRVCRAGRKAVSLDESAILHRSQPIPERKCSQFSETSSNDLSPISSRRSSLYSDDSSRRSSAYSDISPVLNRRTYHHPWPRNMENSGSISPVFGYFMDEMSMLEHQRRFSFDDIYANSDLSFSDLSSDCSVSSSLSNLPGTLYYSAYNPAQDCNSLSYHPYRSSNNIKPSKSCSDFLSVSRILEDYPYLRHRRHSNGQVASDISDFRPNSSAKKVDETSSKEPNTRIHHAVSVGELNEKGVLSRPKSLSSENVPRQMMRFFENGVETYGEVDVCRRVTDELVSSNTADKDFLPVETNTDLLHAALTRKPSDCSTCSTLSGNQEIQDSLPPVKTKSKPSGWRKLRNIVQWTPFFQTYKKHRYPWVQLAGHQGNFKAGPEQGTILKKLCPKEEKCYKILMKDVLRPYVPEYKGQVTCEDTDCIYIQLQDLLVDFTSPCVLDCKLGVRTYLEEELAKAKEKPKLRKDMYEKMIQIDSTAPSSEEHRLRAVTKPRYMVWRETISSTSTLGFRLEGVRNSDGKSSKEFKTTKTREQVKAAFRDFATGFPHAMPKYIQRLKAIKATLEVSIFFSSHEVIGSSLLFVHDKSKANVWLIDFAKTLVLPDKIFIDHKSNWEVGNHEDGYLIGMSNLIEIFSEILEEDISGSPSSANNLDDKVEEEITESCEDKGEKDSDLNHQVEEATVVDQT